MREFLLFLFIAKATADRLGYAYQPLGQVATFTNTGNGLRTNIGGTELEQIITNTNMLGVTDAFGSGLSGFDSSNNNINTFINNDNIINNNNNNIIDNSNNNGFNTITATINGATNFVDSGLGNSYNNGQYNTGAVDTKFSKEFYSYKAPEEDNFNEQDDAGELGAIRKNLRVIFIRAPENQALTNAALQLAKQASEDRTAIYVLTKQTDAAELANRLQTIKSNHNANKPEVHFVKYRTPEDAVRAQQAIQAQYDALGGSTLSSNEGVAPVLNFATSALAGDGGGAGGGFDSLQAFSGGGAAATYLPPALF